MNRWIVVVGRESSRCVCSTNIGSQEHAEWQLLLAMVGIRVVRLCMQRGGPQMCGLELVKLVNVACLSIFHASNDRIALALQRFVYWKGGVWWKIINHLKIDVDAFSFKQDQKLKSGQFHPRYGPCKCSGQQELDTCQSGKWN